MPTSESSATRRKAPRCPPASAPDATTTSTPASSSATASSGVAVLEGDDPALAQRIEQPGVRDAEHEAERRGTCPRTASACSSKLMEKRCGYGGGSAPTLLQSGRSRATASSKRERVISASGRSWFDTQRLSANGPDVASAKLAGDGGDRRRIEVVHAERSQAARAGDGGDEPTLDRPPPNGPRMIGWRSPRSSLTRLACHAVEEGMAITTGNQAVWQATAGCHLVTT